MIFNPLKGIKICFMNQHTVFLDGNVMCCWKEEIRNLVWYSIISTKSSWLLVLLKISITTLINWRKVLNLYRNCKKLWLWVCLFFHFCQFFFLYFKSFLLCYVFFMNYWFKIILFHIQCKNLHSLILFFFFPIFMLLTYILLLLVMCPIIHYYYSGLISLVSLQKFNFIILLTFTNVVTISDPLISGGSEFPSGTFSFQPGEFPLTILRPTFCWWQIQQAFIFFWKFLNFAFILKDNFAVYL